MKRALKIAAIVPLILLWIPYMVLVPCLFWIFVAWPCAMYSLITGDQEPDEWAMRVMDRLMLII